MSLNKNFKLKQACLYSAFLGAMALSPSAHAFDFGKFFSDLFSSVPSAGSKSVAKTNSNSPTGVKIDNNLLKQDQCADNYPWGAPKYKDASLNESMLFLCKKGFAIGYNKNKKIPMWTSEVVLTKNLLNKAFTRTDNFTADPTVPEGMQASLNDYARSGFDRGHMIPAENIRYDEAAMADSFNFTNIVPQVGPNMNRGIWAELETWTRYQGERRGILYVVTGPIFYGKEAQLNSSVSIPTHLYKVIIDPQIKESISFIIPNVQVVTDKFTSDSAGNALYPQTMAKNAYNCSDKGKSVCTIFDFSTSMVEVERLTGLKFISAQSDYDVLKSKVSEDFITNIRNNHPPVR